MFRNILSITALLFLASAISFAQPTTSPADAPELSAKTPADFVEHKSSDGTVVMKAPKDWVEKPGMKDVRLNLIGPDVTSVNVVVIPSMSGGDMQLLLKLLPDQLAKQRPNGKVVKAVLLKLNGEKALRVVIDSTTAQSVHVRMDQIMLFKNGNQYVLTYTALVAVYERFLPVAEQMMASFSVGDGNPAVPLPDYANAQELKAIAPADFVECKSADGSVVLRAPRDWKSQTPPLKEVKLNIAGPREVSVNVGILPANPEETLQSLVDINRQFLAGHFKDYKLLSLAPVKLAGRPAMRIISEMAVSPAVRIRLCQYSVLEKDRLYTVSYNAKVADYDQFLSVGEQIAVTLQIKQIDPGSFFGDFSLSIPTKWTRVKPDRDKTDAMLLLNGSQWNNADAIIKVDTGAAKLADATQVATTMAGKDGKILPDAVTVDGEKGVKISMPGMDLSQPRVVVVVVRNKVAYLISAAAKQGIDVEAPINQVIRSWHWTPEPMAPNAAIPKVASSASTVPKLDSSAVATKPLPTVDQASQQLRLVIAGWQNTTSKPLSVLATMKGDGIKEKDGSITLRTGKGLATSASFRVPVSFRMVCLSRLNDIRIGYAADQIIFNWEMNPDQLRVDGGPANGKHKDGAGRLPPAEWVGIELVVHPNEMIIFVNGVERYRAAGDFSKVNQPFNISAHKGELLIKSLEVVQ